MKMEEKGAEKNGGKVARVEIYPEAAAAHARKESSACVRACCAFSLQSELQKARPDPSRCPLTDFYATIIR